MNTSEHNSSHSIPQPFTIGDTAPSIPAGGGGVSTSLDEPLVAQTKREIRTLAAEIRGLVLSSSSKEEFYAGFLPRLITAMGAEASAVWRVEQSEFQIEAEHLLPPSLVSKKMARRPAAQHRQILEAAAREGKPVLVPPNGVLVEETRPNNPCEHSLILVPVTVDQQIDYLLEVVHNSRGGPAAQRGYLRFVSQMTDLLADYLRRDEIRNGRAQLSRLEAYQACLVGIAATPASSRAQVAADRLCEVLNATQVLILDSGSKSSIQAMSGVTRIDPRSEVTLTAQALAKHEEGSESFVRANTKLCELLQCEELAVWRASTETPALVVGGSSGMAENCLANEDLLSAAVGLLQHQPTQSLPKILRRSWFLRTAIAIAILGVCAVPVPQNIAATGVLEPVQKQAYYAPFDCVVAEVLCSEGDAVRKGQPLLRLESHQLTTEISALIGRQQQVQDRIQEQVAARDRGTSLSAQDIDRLEAEIRQLSIESQALDQQVAILREQASELNVIARVEGKVSTWDLQNQLLKRPVKAGQQLIGTFDPKAGWELQLSIPENRIGLVDAAMQGSGEGMATVKFHLPSAPQQGFSAQLTQLSATTYQDAQSGEQVIIGRATVADGELPVQQTGAYAQASVECGQVSLAWLVLRDAYWAATSSWEMFW